ncbi:MAG: 3-oxoacyl-ACP synthase III family protein [Ekhidna sp.]
MSVKRGLNNVYIKGTGSYTPDKKLPNKYFKKIGSSDEWIFNNLGIKERRIADESETTSDLGAKAAINALQDADLTAKELDLIIVATATPDRLAPSCACFIQEKIEAFNAVAFDISAVCSGALFAISIGHQFLSTGKYENVLVIGADTFSKITDWKRRDSVFFGDGAGAVLLSTTEKKKGFIDFQLNTDGTGKMHFSIPAGGSENPASHQTIDEGLHYFQMNGKEVFNKATEALPKAIEKILHDNDWTKESIDYIVPHQPSIGILKHVAKTLEFPFEKVLTNMDKYANTSGGTIPILLDESLKSNTIKSGDKIVFAAIGAGWTWGTALYQF